MSMQHNGGITNAKTKVHISKAGLIKTAHAVWRQSNRAGTINQMKTLVTTHCRTEVGRRGQQLEK